MCEGLGKTWNVDFLSQLDKTQVLCDFALPRDCMLCGGDLSKGEGNHLLQAGRSDHLICIDLQIQRNEDMLLHFVLLVDWRN